MTQHIYISWRTTDLLAAEYVLPNTTVGQSFARLNSLWVLDNYYPCHNGNGYSVVLYTQVEVNLLTEEYAVVQDRIISLEDTWADLSPSLLFVDTLGRRCMNIHLARLALPSLTKRCAEIKRLSRTGQNSLDRAIRRLSWGFL